MVAYDLTAFDYALFAVLGLSVALGLWRGLVSELMALFAWMFALFAAWRYNEEASRVFDGLIAEPMWRQVAGVALVVVVVLLLTAIVRLLLRSLLQAAGLGATDRFLGALFGFARGFIVSLALVVVGGLAGLSDQAWWANAKSAPTMERAVIAAKPWLPRAVADKIRFR
jgi:membrane protein required for colicin V production